MFGRSLSVSMSVSYPSNRCAGLPQEFGVMSPAAGAPAWRSYHPPPTGAVLRRRGGNWERTLRRRRTRRRLVLARSAPCSSSPTSSGDSSAPLLRCRLSGAGRHRLLRLPLRPSNLVASKSLRPRDHDHVLNLELHHGRHPETSPSRPISAAAARAESVPAAARVLSRRRWRHTSEICPAASSAVIAIYDFSISVSFRSHRALSLCSRHPALLRNLR